MTAPDDRPTTEAEAGPAIRTAPPESPPAGTPHRWWSSIPRNLGRARTSTVVLSLLFIGLLAVYLQFGPETADPSPPRDTGEVDVEVPVVPGLTESVPPTTPSAPATPTAEPDADTTSPTTSPTAPTTPTSTTSPPVQPETTGPTTTTVPPTGDAAEETAPASPTE